MSSSAEPFFISRSRARPPISVIATYANHVCGTGQAGGLLPVPEEASHQHHLADVVGVVVRDQEQLAEVRLAGALRNPREHVDGLVCGQLAHGFAITAE